MKKLLLILFITIPTILSSQIVDYNRSLIVKINEDPKDKKWMRRSVTGYFGDEFIVLTSGGDAIAELKSIGRIERKIDKRGRRYQNGFYRSQSGNILNVTLFVDTYLLIIEEGDTFITFGI